jgi:hypothetical protein
MRAQADGKVESAGRERQEGSYKDRLGTQQPPGDAEGYRVCQALRGPYGAQTTMFALFRSPIDVHAPSP